MSTNRKPFNDYTFAAEMAGLAVAYLDTFPAASAELLG